ncbi:MAG: PAS domain-containing sensor histidine kinase [Ignavibacteriales bacterium]|nr:MAG: PAS domain-containing sensor histidine kinase [Ignavibacteriaceae bacterium]MBW7871823.1 PAS domain-containing sensor histidine kinase [Ignavibacteria bacterium]MCZ2144327.1 PAS domain-containing sensor histidine kinase [Ignavibacteriales bacterium]OQY79257.1 MAG: hypothetical protein B6D45_01165 [Ignavibacteriales bacterium UTCHB3]MBV6446280.1 Sensor histidine kinase RcsC [Ignavibacteriaceae bacterium]
MTLSLLLLLTAVNILVFLLYYQVNNRKSKGMISETDQPTKEKSKYEPKLKIESNEGIEFAGEMLYSLFERSANGIFLFDPKGKLLAVNERALEIFDIQDPRSIHTLDDLENMFPLVFTKQRLEEKDFSYYRAYKVEHIQGAVVKYFVLRYFWYRTADFRETLIIQVRDYTRYRNEELELINQKEKAEQKNRQKSLFLANLSYDIRTPMNTIIGFSTLLKESIEDPELKDMATQIYSGSLNLMKTLDSVIELSKLETKQVVAEKKQIELREVVKRLYLEYKSSFQKKGLNFKLVTPKNDVTFYTDEIVLTKILQHLLSNALKFTESGGTILSLNFDARNGYRNIYISVEDTGVGLSLKDQETIFREFAQFAHGDTRNYKGIGVGLSMVKRYCDIIGIKISISGEPGKGSKFTLKFPETPE